MKKNEIKNSSQLFFYKGNIDFNTSKHLLKDFNAGLVEIDLETIYFHLQQSVEKLLKSLLCKYKIRIQKTHDIEDLIDLLKTNNIVIPNEIECFNELTAYAVEGRYSIILDDIEDSEKYITILEAFIVFVKENIK